MVVTQCALGTYSPGWDKMPCASCGTGYTTATVGSTDVGNCTVAAGYYQTDASVPPSACPKGTYSPAGSPVGAAASCTPCPAGRTTLDAGKAGSEFECNVCEAGYGNFDSSVGASGSCRQCLTDTCVWICCCFFSFARAHRRRSVFFCFIRNPAKTPPKHPNKTKTKTNYRYSPGDITGDCLACAAGKKSRRGSQSPDDCFDEFQDIGGGYYLPGAKFFNSGATTEAACKTGCTEDAGCAHYNFQTTSLPAVVPPTGKCYYRIESGTARVAYRLARGQYVLYWADEALVDGRPVNTSQEEVTGSFTAADCAAMCDNSTACDLVVVTYWNPGTVKGCMLRAAATRTKMTTKSRVSGDRIWTSERGLNFDLTSTAPATVANTPPTVTKGTCALSESAALPSFPCPAGWTAVVSDKKDEPPRCVYMTACSSPACPTRCPTGLVDPTNTNVWDVKTSVTLPVGGTGTGTTVACQCAQPGYAIDATGACTPAKGVHYYEPTDAATGGVWRTDKTTPSTCSGYASCWSACFFCDGTPKYNKFSTVSLFFCVCLCESFCWCVRRRVSCCTARSCVRTKRARTYAHAHTTLLPGTHNDP